MELLYDADDYSIFNDALRRINKFLKQQDYQKAKQLVDSLETALTVYLVEDTVIKCPISRYISISIKHD